MNDRLVLRSPLRLGIRLTSHTTCGVCWNSFPVDSSELGILKGPAAAYSQGSVGTLLQNPGERGIPVAITDLCPAMPCSSDPHRLLFIRQQAFEDGDCLVNLFAESSHRFNSGVPDGSMRIFQGIDQDWQAGLDWIEFL